MSADEAANLDVVPSPEPPRQRYFHFSLAGRAFAFKVENVVEAARTLPVTPLPFVPEWILGISNLRGDVVSIVDLRAFLGLAPPKLRQEDRVVITKSLIEDIQVGLVIDRIDGIRPLQEEPTLSVLDAEELLLSPKMTRFDTYDASRASNTGLQTGD